MGWLDLRDLSPQLGELSCSQESSWCSVLTAVAIALIEVANGARGSWGTYHSLSLADSVAMPFYIGGEPGQGGGEHFAGGIDDVRIYDHALSAAEVQGLAIPEPSAICLLLAGSTCLFGTLRRKNRV